MHTLRSMKSMMNVVIRPTISCKKAVLIRNAWKSLEFKPNSHEQFVRRFSRNRDAQTFKMIRANEIDADLSSGRFSEKKKTNGFVRKMIFLSLFIGGARKTWNISEIQENSRDLSWESKIIIVGIQRNSEQSICYFEIVTTSLAKKTSF